MLRLLQRIDKLQIGIEIEVKEIEIEKVLLSK